MNPDIGKEELDLADLLFEEDSDEVSLDKILETQTSEHEQPNWTELVPSGSAAGEGGGAPVADVDQAGTSEEYPAVTGLDISIKVIFENNGGSDGSDGSIV